MSFAHTFSVPEFDALIDSLGRDGRFAVVHALTLTAKDIQADETAALSESLDRPTPFTLRAYGVDAATMAAPSARVYMRPLQSRYLQWQIEGGARSFKGFELKIGGKTITAYAIPGEDIKLDNFGNVSRADINRIIQELNSPKRSRLYFAGQPKGHPDLPPGIYRRVQTQYITPVFVFAQSAIYAKRLPWRRVAEQSIQAKFKINLAKALASATAR